MIDTTALITGAIRISVWAAGFLIVVFWPGRLGDVPHRRFVVGAAFGCAMVNATLFTLGISGIVTGTDLVAISGGFGTLVCALFLAGLILSAYGPRSWTRE